jgi:hypothetical protein
VAAQRPSVSAQDSTKADTTNANVSATVRMRPNVRVVPR